ncbi:MAG: DUF1569 domain-containing protein [Crocinitomicaceae bacterium]
MKNVFDANDAKSYIERINKLEPAAKAQWGKMNAAQMLAHCNVTYDMALTDQYPKATGFKKFILKLLVKQVVVNEKPYKKNSRTAPDFLIADNKDFAIEQKKITSYIENVQALGANHFDGKESTSFGALNKTEWNNMFAKHLDHHLEQFGV